MVNNKLTVNDVALIWIYLINHKIHQMKLPFRFFNFIKNLQVGGNYER